MKKNIVILSLLFIGCIPGNKEGKTDTQIFPKVLSVDKTRTGLKLKTQDFSHLINIEDSLFNYSISPDSTAVLINYRKMSNIQVSELYSLVKDSQKVNVVEKSLSAAVWDSISNKLSIHRDDIINPKTMASFTEDNKIRIQLNGQTELGLKVNEVIEMDERLTRRTRR